MTREITIYDIARHLDIAASTVSRGLKGHSSVSKKTQELIQQTAEEMGYHVNAFAAGLSTKRTRTIGVIIPRMDSNFTASVLAGIEKVCNDSGYILLITQSQESKQKEIANARTMLTQRVDGLLVSLSEDSNDLQHFDSFLKKQVPVLFFDRCPTANQFPSVAIDNKEAGYLATKYLLQNGAERIIHLTVNNQISIYQDRLEGYKKALIEHGLGIDNNLIIETDLSEHAGKHVAEKAIGLKADAVFAANDVSAVCCMNTLREKGYSIPQDFQIIGFNNDISSRNSYPALSTINNPGYQMGELAATNLIHHLTERTDLNISSGLILKSDLVLRGSTR